MAEDGFQTSDSFVKYFNLVFILSFFIFLKSFCPKPPRLQLGIITETKFNSMAIFMNQCSYDSFFNKFETTKYKYFYTFGT